MARGFVVALLGAESTGKTTLAQQLGEALAAPGRRVEVVAEVLREFCGRHDRTPLEHEQRGIAAEQTRRIEAAAASADLVVADTTALMIAVYSEQVFGDAGLYAEALAAQARCDLTLLTALDLPWVADGLNRDGPHVRLPVDTKLRAALGRAGLPFGIVAGHGEMRLAAALAAVERAIAPAPDPSRRWAPACERCGDADCEHRLLPRL
jgi:nicotinamide riboside kinase